MSNTKSTSTHEPGLKVLIQKLHNKKGQDLSNSDLSFLADRYQGRPLDLLNDFYEKEGNLDALTPDVVGNLDQLFFPESRMLSRGILEKRLSESGGSQGSAQGIGSKMRAVSDKASVVPTSFGLGDPLAVREREERESEEDMERLIGGIVEYSDASEKLRDDKMQYRPKDDVEGGAWYMQDISESYYRPSHLLKDPKSDRLGRTSDFEKMQEMQSTQGAAFDKYFEKNPNYERDVAELDQQRTKAEKSIDASWGQLRSYYERRLKEESKNNKVLSSLNPRLGFQEQYIKTPKYKSLEAIVRNGDKLLEYLHAPEKGGFALRKLVEGIGDADWKSVFTLGFSQLAPLAEESGAYKRVAEAQKNGQVANAEDLKLVEMMTMANQISSSKDPSILYEIGKAAPEQIAFFVEMALTSGVSGGVSRAARRTLGKIAESSMRKVPKAVAKGGVKLGEVVVGGSVQSLAMPHHIAANYGENRKSQYDVGYGSDGSLEVSHDYGESSPVTLLRSVVQNAIEITSEKAGGVLFDPVLKPFGRFLRPNAWSPTSRLGLNIGAGINYMSQRTPGYLKGTMASVAGMADMDGMLGEYSEEVLGKALNTVLPPTPREEAELEAENAERAKMGLKPISKWHGFWDKDEMLTTVGTILLTSGVTRGLGGQVDLLRKRKDVKDAMHQMPKEVRSDVVRAMSGVTLEDVRRNMDALGLDKLNLTNAEQQSVERFVAKKFAYDMVTGAKLSKEMVEAQKGVKSDVESITHRSSRKIVVVDGIDGKNYAVVDGNLSALGKDSSDPSGTYIVREVVVDESGGLVLGEGGNQQMSLSGIGLGGIETAEPSKVFNRLVNSRLGMLVQGTQEQLEREIIEFEEEAYESSLPELEKEETLYNVGTDMLLIPMLDDEGEVQESPLESGEGLLFGSMVGDRLIRVFVIGKNGAAKIQGLMDAKQAREVKRRLQPNDAVVEAEADANVEVSASASEVPVSASASPAPLSSQSAEVVPGEVSGEGLRGVPVAPAAYPLNKNGEVDFDLMRGEQLIRYAEENLSEKEVIESVSAQAKAEQKKLDSVRKKYASATIPQRVKLKNEESKIREDLQIFEAYLLKKSKEQSERIQREVDQEREVRGQSSGALDSSNPIVDRWTKARKVIGHSMSLPLPGGQKLKGRYVLTVQGAATASHDASRNFAQSEGFPTTETGGSVNDRDYTNKNAQNVEIEKAQRYDGRAVTNAPKVQDGVVIDGNGRTIAGQIASSSGKDGLYVDFLRENAHIYGFTADQVDAMTQEGSPRLYFEVAEDSKLPLTPETFALFNEQETKTQSQTEQTVKYSKLVTKQAAAAISDILGRYESLDALYRSEIGSSELLGVLERYGLMNANQRAQYRKSDVDSSMSVVGQEFFENVVVGSVLEESAVKWAQSNPFIRRAIVKAISPLVENGGLDPAYTLREELSEAVVVLSKALLGGVVKYGEATDLIFRQVDAFDKSVRGLTVQMFTHLLNGKDYDNLKKVVSLYNRSALLAQSGQGDLFTGEVATKEQISLEILNSEGYDIRFITPSSDADSADARGETGAVRRDVSSNSSGEAVGDVQAVSSSDGSGTSGERRERSEGPDGSIDGGSFFGRLKTPPHFGQRGGREDVIKLAERLSKRLGSKVNLIESREALREIFPKAEEKDLRRRKGWYDAKTGEVYLVVPNARGDGDVMATLLHELVGHKGLRALFGDDFDRFLDSAYQKATRGIQRKIDAMAKAEGLSLNAATEEYLADLAENGFDSMDERSFIGQLYADFVKMLRDLGMLFHLDFFTEKDFVRLMWESQNNLEGKTATGYLDVIRGRAKMEENVEKSLEKSEGNSNFVKNNGDGIYQRVSEETPRSVDEGAGSFAEASAYLRGEIQKRLRKSSQGPRDGKEAVSIHEQRELEFRIIHDYAQANGLWIDNIYTLGRPYLSGNENTVVLNSEENVVYKSNNLMSSLTISDLFRRMQIHNQLFPDTRYQLVGFTGISSKGERAPYVEVLLQQEYIERENESTPAEIAEYMQNLGFTMINDTSFTNGQYLVSDLLPRNVVKGENGVLHVVDAEIKDVLFEAELETDVDPTEEQKKAGNYKKGHFSIDGMEVTIENPKGSERSGTDADGNSWSITMANTYGYIRGTKGTDGDHIDVFFGDALHSPSVYVVDQTDEDGAFDEHKVMYGFRSLAEAKAAYYSNYEEGWDRLGTITEVSKSDFKKWLESSVRKQKAFSEYKGIEKSLEKSEGNSNFVKKENAEYPSTYETQEGQTIRFRSWQGELPFAETDPGANASRRPNGVRGRTDLPSATNSDRLESSIPSTLRKLGEGEFAHVERIFTEFKAFEFFAPSKIESYQDVAYIFKQLEDESIENCFAVLVKDGAPTVIHVGMGTFASSFVHFTPILMADKMIDADAIYFAHNHPSGNLNASAEDKGIHKRLSSIFGTRFKDSIIINARSGQFATFSANGASVLDSKITANASPIIVHKFDKQVFSPGYNPRDAYKISSSFDVGKFLSSHRLGDRSKLNYLLLNGTGVVGNVFSPYTKIDQKNSAEVCRDIVYKAGQFGARAVILYGSIPATTNQIQSIQDLRDEIAKVSNTEISLLDVISIEGNHQNYRSYKDEGDIRFRKSSLSSEEREIVEKAKANGTYLKAPNGEPSNLDEKQWVQVRTKAFKDWFGDWEKAVRIEKLRKSRPIEITGEEYKGKYELNRDSAKGYIKNYLRDTYKNNDTGESIIVSRRGANEVTSHGERDLAHLKSIYAIPKIIENSIYIGEEKNNKETGRYQSYRYYVTGLKISGVDYTVKMVVGRKGDAYYYDHALTKIEKGTFINATRLTNSLDSDKNSLSVGKDTKLFSILQNNSSKVVDENGEPMVVYHGTGAKFAVFEAVQSSVDFQEAMYFSKSKNVANTYSGSKGTIFDLYLNIKNPYITDAGNKDFNSFYYEMVNGLNHSKDNGYDGYIVKNIKDDWEQKNNYKPSTTFATFNSTQIKSATDNNGAFSGEDPNIYFRIGNSRKREMLLELAKARPDMSEAQRLETVAEIEKLGEEVKRGGSPKIEKLAQHFVLKGTLILPEDNYKLVKAYKVAEKKGIDPFAFDNPTELIETYAEVKIRGERTNPDTVSAFSHKQVHEGGIVIYDVQDDRVGQAAVRMVIDTHWGEDANPWCLAARIEGNLDQAYRYWESYHKIPKRIAFLNGKLLAFNASNHRQEWWDRQDRSRAGVPITRKIENDALGRTGTVEYDVRKRRFGKVYTGVHKGNKENGVYEVWHDNGTLWERANYKSGKLDGLRELWYDNGTLSRRENYKSGDLDGLREKWYKNGKLSERENYKSGDRDGLHEWWNDNGTLCERWNYKSGDLDGLIEAWHDNGTLRRRTNYKDGRLDGLYEFWYDNGTLCERANYKSGDRDGLREVWYDNGTLRERWNYKDGRLDGLYEFWYDNGTLSERTNYKAGERDGLYEEWYRDGTLRNRANYKSGIQDDSSAVKDRDVRFRDTPSFAGDFLKGDGEGSRKASAVESVSEARALEEARIVSQAKADGTYMKAPNGEPTNLTEKQWVQVRTQAFKDWFGDWEKAIRIEKLRKSKPIEITGEEIIPDEDLKVYKKNALEYGKSMRGEYQNEDSNERVFIGRNGLKEVLNHDYKNKDQIQSIAAIPQIIKKSIFLDSANNTDHKVDAEKFDYYACGLKIGGVDYTVRSVFVTLKDGTRYYDHKLTKIEKGKLIDSLIGTTPGFNQKASLSEGKDTKLISILQNNSSKVVDENGEPKVVYHGTGAKFAVFDEKKIGSNGTSDGQGFYFTTDRSYADGYKNGNGELLEVFLNVRKPLDRHRLTFSKSDVKRILMAIDDMQIEGKGHSFLSNYGDIDYEGLTKVLRNAVDIEFESAENDVDLVGGIINGVGSVRDVYLALSKTTGHDGGIVSKDDGSIHYVVGNGVNIKSATDNNGAFSGEDPNIYFRDSSEDSIRASSVEGMLSDYDRRVESARAAYERAKRDYRSKFSELSPLKEGQENLFAGDFLFSKSTVSGDLFGGDLSEFATTEEQKKLVLAPYRRALEVATAQLNKLGIERRQFEERVRKFVDSQQVLFRDANEALDRLSDVSDGRRDSSRGFAGDYLLGENEDVRYRRDAINDKFNAELQQQIAGTLPKGHVYTLGMPSGSLLASGVENLPIEMEADHLQRKSSQKNHVFDLSDVKGLPEALANPIAIFESTKKDGTIIVLTELKKGNDNFVIAIRVWREAPSRKNTIEVNSIRSLYPKDNVEGILDWINSKDKLLKWRDKEKALVFISAQSTNLIAGGNNPKSILATKVVQNFENPKLSEGNIRFREADASEVAMPYRKGDRFMEHYTDSMLPMKKFQEWIEQQGGVVSSESDVYNGQNRAASRAMDADIRFEKKYMTALLEATKVLQGLHGGSTKGLELYMIAKHIPERNETMRGREYAAVIAELGLKGKTEEDRQRILDENRAIIGAALSRDYAGASEFYLYAGQTPEQYVEEYESEVLSRSGNMTAIDTFWKVVNDATHFGVDYLTETGLMKPGTADMLKARWQYYVPLQGWQSGDDLNVGEYTQKIIFGTEFFKPRIVKGRKTLPDSPLANIQRNAHMAISQGETNRFRGQLLKLAAQNEALSDHIQVVDEKARLSHANVKGGGFVKVYDKGTARYVMFENNVEVASAINGDNLFKMAGYDVVIKGMQWVGGATKVLTQMMTSKNPAFAVHNLLRDMQFVGYGYLIDKDAAFVGRVMKNYKYLVNSGMMWKDARGVELGDSDLEQHFREWKRLGGRTGFTNMKSIDDIKKSIDRSLNGWNKRRLANPFSRDFALAKALGYMGDAFEVVSTVSENATRFAVYMASLEGSKKVDGEYTDDAKFNAITECKNSSTNFDRRGSGSALLRALYGFFNAQLQGTMRVLQIANKHKGRFMAAAGVMFAMGFLEAVLNARMGDDDEEYYLSLSDFDRATNMIFGKVRVPLPHFFRGIKNMGVQAYLGLRGKKDWQEALLNSVTFMSREILPDAINPLGDFEFDKHGRNVVLGNPREHVPTLFSPLFDVFMNENFAGYRVRPEYVENIPKAFQWTRSVNKPIKYASEYLARAAGGHPVTGKFISGGNHPMGGKEVNPWLDWNPNVIEFLITSYVPGVGKFAMDLFNLARNVVDRDVDIKNIPIANRIYKPRTDEQLEMKTYYDLKADADYFLKQFDFMTSVVKSPEKILRRRGADEFKGNVDRAVLEFSALATNKMLPVAKAIQAIDKAGWQVGSWRKVNDALDSEGQVIRRQILLFKQQMDAVKRYNMKKISLEELNKVLEAEVE